MRHAWFETKQYPLEHTCGKCGMLRTLKPGMVIAYFKEGKLVHESPKSVPDCRPPKKEKDLYVKREKRT